MLKKRFCIFLISLSMCFCIYPKAKKSNVQYPSWILEPYSQFDKDAFFVTVGNDKNKSTAELKAVEELASIFG